MEHISLITTGFMIVIGVLVGLWAVCSLVALGFKEKPKPPKPETPLTEGIPAHHVAAITAAIAAIMSEGHRIVKIDAPPHVANGWGESNFLQQTFAHRIRWDWKIPGPPHVNYKPKEIKGK
ncbi:MAG: hypothetical protein OQK35_04855 [Alphaproteobacteria bacterium]|nr:hypothetical protein [Alphaproteobacteria bacterium]